MDYADKYLYVVISQDFEWEDLIIFNDDLSAKEYSSKFPNIRVEIFTITNESKAFVPTYNFYKNGILYIT
jgi:hypothetical protein